MAAGAEKIASEMEIAREVVLHAWQGSLALRVALVGARERRCCHARRPRGWCPIRALSVI